MELYLHCKIRMNDVVLNQGQGNVIFVSSGGRAINIFIS
jgi:hypothetical protein